MTSATMTTRLCNALTLQNAIDWQNDSEKTLYTLDILDLSASTGNYWIDKLEDMYGEILDMAELITDETKDLLGIS